MGSDRSLAEYSAILVPHRSIADDTISTARSTFVEADPTAHPVLPDAGTDTALAFTASGTADVGRDLQLRVARGGVPDGVRGLALLWRNAAGEDWVGWDNYMLFTGYEPVAWSTSTTLGYQRPDLIALPSGVMITAFDEPDSASRRAVRTRRWIPGAGWDAASSDVWVEGENNYAAAVHPALTRLPSGRVLLFHLVYLSRGGVDFAQVWMWYSDDDGESWTRGAKSCLLERVDISTAPAKTVVGMRVAYGRGQLLLAIAYSAPGPVDRVLHYASVDGGSSFSLIETLRRETASEVDIAALALVYTRGQFVLAVSVSVSGVKLWRAGSATARMTRLDGVTPSGDWNALESSHFSMAADEEGNLFAVGGYGSADVLCSPDAGDTWTPIGAAFNTGYLWSRGGDVGLVHLAAAVHRGRLVVVGGYGGATPVHALLQVQLGGYTTVPVPEVDVDAAVSSQVAPLVLQALWTDVWIGPVGPVGGYGNWTSADTGAPTYGATAEYQAVSTGAGDASAADLEDVAGATYSFDQIVVGSVTVVAGQHRVEFRNSKGTKYTLANLLISPSQISLADPAGAGSIVASHTAGARIDFVVSLRGRSATAWWREHDTSTDRRYTLLGTLSGTLTETTAAATTRIRWSVPANSIVEWHWLAAYQGEDLDSNLADGLEVADLVGRPASGAAALYVDDGISVRAVDGPGLAGETFTMLGGGSRPLAWSIPSVAPSPAQYAELEHDDDVVIAFDLDAEPTSLGCDAIGVFLGAAVPAAELWGDDGVSWAKICDLATSSTCYATKRGSSLVPRTPAPATGPTTYLERDELVGGWVILSDGATTTTARISANTEGQIGLSAAANNTIDGRAVVITLTGGDAVAGDVDVVIVPPRTAHVVSLEGETFKTLGVLLNPTAGAYPPPPWGRIRVGTLAIGPLAIFGWRTARDHAVDVQSLARVVEQADGSTWSRAVGVRRVVEFSGSSESVDVTTARGTSSPDWVRLSDAGEPVAHRRDLPLMLAGLLSEVEGPHRPVVWLPRVPHLGGDVVASFGVGGRAGGAVYGRIVSTARLETVTGRPQADEVLRGPRWSIQEEL